MSNKFVWDSLPPQPKNLPPRRPRQPMRRGGKPTASAQMPAQAATPPGLLHSDVAGRTDRLPMAVTQNSYVIPADVVSGLGQGNSLAGGKLMDQIFQVSPQKKSAGGPTVDIVAAGGEYIVPAEAVLRIGNGDMKRGHDLLDKMVKNIRSETIKRMAKLPQPKK